MMAGQHARMSMPPERNVLGEELQPCSLRPLTGFYRDGCCATGPEDAGAHVVCAEFTAAFLAFSRARGNDLGTPMPDLGFPGLRPGDCWCAARWKEAGVAPPVVLRATHAEVLQYVRIAELKRHALDLA
jgi:uncharacterized protein